jgi:hypothetical protein
MHATHLSYLFIILVSFHKLNVKSLAKHTAGKMATFRMELLGAEQGDATLAGHSAVVATQHRVQLTANGGEGFVEAIMQNAGDETVDVPAGLLRVVVMKVM